MNSAWPARPTTSSAAAAAAARTAPSAGRSRNCSGVAAMYRLAGNTAASSAISPTPESRRVQRHQHADAARHLGDAAHLHDRRLACLQARRHDRFVGARDDEVVDARADEERREQRRASGSCAAPRLSVPSSTPLPDSSLIERLADPSRSISDAPGHRRRLLDAEQLEHRRRDVGEDAARAQRAPRRRRSRSPARGSASARCWGCRRARACDRRCRGRR